MEQLLGTAAHYAALLIEAMALTVIAMGCIEGFVFGLRAQFAANRDSHEMRRVWLRFSRWLIAGLTFQLAADLIHTTIAPTWDDIGRLGAIAAIRTFLNYFLERDMGELRELQRDDTRQDAAGRKTP